MMNLRALVRAAINRPESIYPSTLLDIGGLEDRVLFSATPMDVAEVDSNPEPLPEHGAAGEFDFGEAPLESMQHDESCNCCSCAGGQLHDDGDPFHDDHLFDEFGNEYHALPVPETLESDPSSGDDSSLADPTEIVLSETFNLHSNAGASHTIYLDFDGHTTSGTYWNSSKTGGADFVTAAFDLDGDTSTFNDAELERIQHIWQRVAEDFMPFDVNVTTQDPGLDGLIKSGSGDSEWGQRVVIGGSAGDWYGSSAGGVAYVGSFNWSSDTPTYVFENNLGGSEKNIAEAASHEAGHTLGLSHDGKGSSSYYYGHGSWAPIMGVGYNKAVTQWSAGDYDSATNTQDDLSIITSNNGFGYRIDDHGNDTSGASLLSFSGSTVYGDGIIEQNTDVDVFEFFTDGGLVDINIDPAERGPNLDILVELYDAASQLVTFANPLNTLDANLNLALSAGQYFLHVTGTGTGDPNTGYSDYGSLGQYTISGTIQPSTLDTVSIVPVDATVDEGNATGATLTFEVIRSGNLDDGTSVDYQVQGMGTNAADNADFLGGLLPTGTVTFQAEETSKLITINLAGDSVVEPDETFAVVLSNPTGDTQLGQSQAIGTVLDDDAIDTSDSLSISTLETAKAEGDTGTTTFQFTVTRTGYTDDATSVSYSVNGASSNPTQQSDFSGGTLPSGTVNFAAGQESATIQVDVVGDIEMEADESFRVTLSNAQGDTSIMTTSAVATVVNDDSPPPTPGITVTPTSGLTTSERGGSASFTVALDSPPDEVVTISVYSSDTTEGRVSTNTLTFTSDNWSAQEVTVTGENDFVRDGNVAYSITLGPAVSSDANYHGLDADDVQLTNQDDEKGKKSSGDSDGGSTGGGGKGKGKSKKAPSAISDTELAQDQLSATDLRYANGHDRFGDLFSDRSHGTRIGASLRQLFDLNPSSDDSD